MHRFAIVRARSGLASAALACSLAVGAALVALAQDAPLAGPAVVSAAEPLAVREAPGWDAAALLTLNPGEWVEALGATEFDADGSPWALVSAAGVTGYVPAWSLAAGAGTGPDEVAADPAAAAAPEWTAEPEAAPEPAPETDLQPAAAVAAGDWTTTNADASLRAAPDHGADVLVALPPGAGVSVDGDPVDGFLPVTVDGVSGWIAAELLGEAAAAPVTGEAVAPAPAPEAAPASDSAPAEAPDAARAGRVAFPFRGGTWKVIQGYNGGTHTNRSDFAQYQYALDWARADGETAGEPIFAPVSGTVKWTDPGSGGLLIDMGDGHGVAMFHLTLDGSIGAGTAVERGQRLGVISGPGGPGYMSTPHLDMTLWRIDGGGHVATPWSGKYAIGGHDFPDIGGGNQHMDYTVSP